MLEPADSVAAFLTPATSTRKSEVLSIRKEHVGVAKRVIQAAMDKLQQRMAAGVA